MNLYIALIYAVLYCWLESIPIAFEQVYGFSLGITGLCFIGLAVGGLICIPPYFYYNYKYVEPRFSDNGTIRPEIRLEVALVGSFCLPICLFMFGWTANGVVPWIVPVIATAFFTIGAFCAVIFIPSTPTSTGHTKLIWSDSSHQSSTTSATLTPRSSPPSRPATISSARASVPRSRSSPARCFQLWD